MRIDGPDRHAPEGYKICMQFFQGETKEEALQIVTKEIEIPIENLIVLPGHFNNSNTFRPFGWMVFRKKECYD